MSPHAIAALTAALLGLAGCSDALDRNLSILEGTDTPPEEQQETPDASPAKPNPIPILEEPVNTPEPFECVSIFRRQTCEQGVLYMLDDQMNWILPGRTE